MSYEEKATGQVYIRPISVDDAAAIASLSGELGYPAEAEVMARRVRSVLSTKGQTAFAGVLQAEVVGWIEVALSFHLQSEPHAVIGGLVVRSDVRSLGVGAALCARAEQWAREQGVTVMRVRSQVARERAHKFYENLGYKRVKTSAVFEKCL